MSRASGSDLASRSSLVTTNVSPARQAARALPQSGARTVGAGQSVVDIDALGGDAETGERVTLSSEVLLVGMRSLCPKTRSRISGRH